MNIYGPEHVTQYKGESISLSKYGCSFELLLVSVYTKATAVSAVCDGSDSADGLLLLPTVLFPCGAFWHINQPKVLVTGKEYHMVPVHVVWTQ